MAVSAFRSTSKRGSLASAVTSTSSSSCPSSGSNSSGKSTGEEDGAGKPRPRRARSVSAPSSGVSVSGAAEAFVNKRDNPLFSPKESENVVRDVGRGGFRGGSSNNDVSGSAGRRGRSASRGSFSCGELTEGYRKGIGRSLSRVDSTRQRMRSVSRESSQNFESEKEQEEEGSSVSVLSNKMIHESFRSLAQKKGDAYSDMRKLVDPLSRSSDGLMFDLLDESSQTQFWEDEDSSCSLSEVEAKAITLACQKMKNSHIFDNGYADGIYETVQSEVRHIISEIRNDIHNEIQRKIYLADNIVSTPDVAKGLIDPDSTILISGIRKDYARKLEQSRERVRKLRADLEFEEQHVYELNRFLTEEPSCSVSSEVLKSRPRRKFSIERREMSKQLTEEAFNYFDECVSISTLDSADFSSVEDPSTTSVIVSSDISDAVSLHGIHSLFTGHSSSHPFNWNKEADDQSQCSFSFSRSDLTDSSISRSAKYSLQNNGSQDSLACCDKLEENQRMPLNHEGFHINHYVKTCDSGNRRDASQDLQANTRYSAKEYDLKMFSEKLLHDRVLLKNRIDCGGLLLCKLRNL